MVVYATIVALRQILLKIHGWCNLACTYCYVYTSADDSWRTKPKRMSLDTVKLTASRMRAHASRHGITRFSVIFHGGEPLLAGAGFIDAAAGILREAMPSTVQLDLSIQTNGLLLDEAFLEVFERHGIKVGVSLDGGATANDRHRRFANGEGSHAKVATALTMLAERTGIYSGILATVDLANPAAEVYHDLLAFRPPRLDFLLPHGTWDSPPPGRVTGSESTPYADWLLEAFDLWYAAKPPPVRIRLFESLLSLLLGGPSYTEMLGLHPIDLVTIETDGSIEQGDILKIVGQGAAATGLHIATHDFDAVLESPGIRARRLGLAALGAQCQRCELVSVCGGGHYAHRFGAGGFDHPSVYCLDLFKLIRTVRGRIVTDLAPAVRLAPQ
jgi:uncharacterized protein